jgi:hypothetical protein
VPKRDLEKEERLILNRDDFCSVGHGRESSGGSQVMKRCCLIAVTTIRSHQEKATNVVCTSVVVLPFRYNEDKGQTLFRVGMLAATEA